MSKENVESLVWAIEEIPGQKMLTLFQATGNLTIDILEGRFGHAPEVREIFDARADLGGVLLIRQFLQETLEDAKGRTIPRKNLYGMLIQPGGIWEWMDASEVYGTSLKKWVLDASGKQYITSVFDPETGRPFEYEPGVIYCGGGRPDSDDRLDF